MYSAPKVTKVWQAAKAYCEDSKAQLVKTRNPEDLLLLSHLAKNRSESIFWTDQRRRSSGRKVSQCYVFDRKMQPRVLRDCSRTLPFICERGMRFILSYRYSFVHYNPPDNSIAVRKEPFFSVSAGEWKQIFYQLSA